MVRLIAKMENVSIGTWFATDGIIVGITWTKKTVARRQLENVDLF